MDDEQHRRLDRELADLGAQWRAETPVDFEPREIRRPTLPPTGWLLTAAAAVLVIGAVIGALALSPGGKAGPASSPKPDVVDRLDCARPALTTVKGSPAVPEGAVAARLCGRSINSSGFDEAWPLDTLDAADAAKLVAAINQLGPWHRGADAQSCPPSLDPPFRLILRYADGSRVSVRGFTDCGQRLAVRGGADFGNATSISDLALRLVKHERQTRTTVRNPIPPNCPAKWQTVGGTIGAGPVKEGDDVAVTACQYRLDSDQITSQGRLDFQATVNDPAALLAAARDGVSGSPCTTIATVQRVLLVRDRFGDINVVSTDPCLSNTLGGAPSYPSPSFAEQVTNLFPERLRTP